MRILGIDPGLRKAGFAIIAYENQCYSYIASGTISTQADMSLAARLKVLYLGIEQIMHTYPTDYACIEKVFINNNPQSSLLLGQARGAILTSLAMQHADVFEYTALQIKQSVSGRGKAKKTDIQQMVMRILKLPTPPKPDAADALACAITHVHHCTLLSQLHAL